MIRIIAFGAHPDDCEFGCGGTAVKWAAAGHAVKFVAVTNGDIGHFAQAGGPLAQRRAAETRAAAKILGIAETEVLDNHDGELEPTLENRKTIVRLIRRWKADVVLSHRPNDYHPDHRYTGILVQDAAYMVTVPFFCPDTPALSKNPLFLYFPDLFTQPTPFTPHVTVAIDDVLEKKMAALEAMESQTIEAGCEGTPDLVPRDAASREARRRAFREQFLSHFRTLTDRFRASIAEWYAGGHPEQVKIAEAFQVCEYSQAWASISAAARATDNAELRRVFPFHPSR
jgi:LmbE family N-acetylglucosaminyl deacetylase